MLTFPLTTGIQVARSVATETYDELAPIQLDRPRGNLVRQYTNEASEFIKIGESTIHYRDEGNEDGPTLLLIHGTYSSLHTWDGWVEELKDDFRLVRLDMPGFGLTGPRVKGEHRLEVLIETVERFCDALGLSDIAVAGNSLGGGVAWRLSLERPDIVSRLVLIDAGGATLLSKLGRKYTPLGTDFLPRFLTPRMVIRVILKDAYGDPSKVTDDLVRRYHDLLLRAGNRRAVIEIARNYRRDHGRDATFDLLDVRTPALPSNHNPSPNVHDGYDISDVSVPVLFQWGTEDEWLPVDFGQQLADSTPTDHTFCTYEGIGHVPMEEAPKMTATDAARFIKAQQPQLLAD